MLTPQDTHQFHAYLSGELTGEEASAFEDALATDEALLSAFEAYAAAHPALLPEGIAAPPAQFTDRVRDRIRRRSGGRIFQEDLVTTRYIPIFVIAAFVLLLVIALAGRKTAAPGLEEDAEIVEQGAVDSAEETRVRRRVRDRENRRTPSPEDYMKPASHNRDYRDLPVSGGRTPDSVTYTRRVWMVKSTKDEAALRSEIEEVFGRRELEGVDGYLRMKISDREISGAYQRLELMDAKADYVSTEVTGDEVTDRYIRFYYDSADAVD